MRAQVTEVDRGCTVNSVVVAASPARCISPNMRERAAVAEHLLVRLAQFFQGCPRPGTNSEWVWLQYTDALGRMPACMRVLKLPRAVSTVRRWLGYRRM